MRKMLTFGMILMTFIYFIPICYMNYGTLNWGLELADTSANYAGNEEKIAQTINDLTEKSCEITIKTGDETRTLPLETYVAGVVAAEIAPDFPEAALQAQAVAARTYAVYKQRMGRPAQHADAERLGRQGGGGGERAAGERRALYARACFRRDGLRSPADARAGWQNRLARPAGRGLDGLLCRDRLL